ncbi:MAG: hypothetical protein ACE5F5_07200 [Acidimicrobiia bacterium]
MGGDTPRRRRPPSPTFIASLIPEPSKDVVDELVSEGAIVLRIVVEEMFGVISIGVVDRVFEEAAVLIGYEHFDEPLLAPAVPA